MLFTQMDVQPPEVKTQNIIHFGIAAIETIYGSSHWQGYNIFIGNINYDVMQYF